MNSLLLIDTKDKLDKMIDEYGTNLNVFTIINWSKIASKFDGILFLNYHKIKSDIRFSMKYTFYSAIDINCACIWNPTKVVKQIDLIKKLI